MSRVRSSLPLLAAGGLVALSLPPWGWWPLAYVGLAMAVRGLENQGWRPRVAAGVAFGLGMFVPGLWWMHEFTAVGAPLAVLVEVAFVVVAAVSTPPGRGRALAFPAALVLAEWARGQIPFGGVPMAGLALGQVSSPLAQVARAGGYLALVALAALTGVALDAAWRRRWPTAAAAIGTVVVLAAVSWAAPDGGSGPTRLIAIAQGGGGRGLRAIETDPRLVLDAHLAVSTRVKPPIDLLLWPEDVIDVDQRVADAPEGEEVAAVARQLNAPLVAGVVEDDGPDHFFNAVVEWAADGTIIGRYDKVHRVPFGEYVPGRALIKHLVNLDVVSRDAVAGHGPGVLDTPIGRVGVLISYEVYFAGRGRDAIRAGGRLLLVPTNASSFKTSQVPTTEVATAQLRAIESGRDVVQAAPTGYGAYIDNHGRLLARTTLSRQEVRQRRVHLRSGRTLYVRAGNIPVLWLSVALVALAWVRDGALSPARRRSRRPGPP